MTAGRISDHDLRSLRVLLDLSAPARQGEPLDATWESTLSTVMAIVPCDAVTLQVQDVQAQQVLAIRQVSDRYEVCTDLDDAAAELYWRRFWASDCCYPQRSGDYFSVVKTTDFEPGGALFATMGKRRALAEDGCRLARITLPQRGSVDYRVLLWRMDGRDFSDRDMVLLSVLRSTLVAIRDRTFQPGADRPELTPRQLQLLGLVAEGLTNRQTARQLGVSEHTVRKHVENIFERLQVSSRTAAVNRVFLGDPASATSPQAGPPSVAS
jgi:DNA-binding CsgD family transcriptional regulator